MKLFSENKKKYSEKKKTFSDYAKTKWQFITTNKNNNIMKKILSLVILFAIAGGAMSQTQDKKYIWANDLGVHVNFLSGTGAFNDLLTVNGKDEYNVKFMPELYFSFRNGTNLNRFYFGTNIGLGMSVDFATFNECRKKKLDVLIYFDLGYKVFDGESMSIDIDAGAGLAFSNFSYNNTKLEYIILDDYMNSLSFIVPLSATWWYCHSGYEIVGVSVSYNFAFNLANLGFEDLVIKPSTLGVGVKFRL